ncbi:MAG: hypothetical protein E7409_07640 [Ruminococcaceae bacterium]|nr:hypothetical protein [Oscillospiraceae bacterium]
MITFEQVSYKKLGNCLKMSNGKLEAVITLDFGPRIIRAGFTGGENFFFEDEENVLRNDKLGADCGFHSSVFDLAGGHRLWISPEAMPRTYYPDDLPVAWEKTDNGVILTPPPQERNGFQLQMIVTMQEENQITVEHLVTNVGLWPVKFAPWAISMMIKGGKEVIPVNDADTGYLNNRHVELWPYTKMTDDRIYWGDRYLVLSQDENATFPFKMGMKQDYPWAAYFVHGDLFIKRYCLEDGAEYPDHGCSYETYTNNLFCEMESLGAYREVAVGETVSHTEVWDFYQNVAFPGTDEEKLDEFAKEYME